MPHDYRCGSRWLRSGAAIVTLAACGYAGAAAYRCDGAGKVTYTNLPCATGRQTELQNLPQAPAPEDRAAAAIRRRADDAALAALERDRANTRRSDERAAAIARRTAGHDTRAATCTKLALRAKRAGEDAETAGPRDQARKRILARRTDEDYAATCKRH